MKNVLMLMLATVSFAVMTGCYRPIWYRTNTTYVQLKWDSEWCKSRTNIGSTRQETIDQYERCMRDKGYELKDKADSSGGEPTIRVEQKEGLPIVIDKNARVYVVGRTSRDPQYPYYRYFHRKDCKYLRNESPREMTAGEAITEGMIPCPDCFRD